jgi:hypothetical protein
MRQIVFLAEDTCSLVTEDQEDAGPDSAGPD